MLRLVVPPCNFLSIKFSRYLYVLNQKLENAAWFHANSQQKSETVVSTMCNSLRHGLNWDALNRKFDYLVLNDSFVENVLLELKEPSDAKCALGFFHWSAKEKKFEHKILSYCLTISILVRAQLLKDAKALLESILKRDAEKSPKLAVVNSLLHCYKITSTSSLVFDLLIQAYAKLRLPETGFDICCYVEKHGFSVSLTTFNTLLDVAQKSEQYPLVWRIYEHMIQKRTYPSETSIRILISALCKEGKLQTFMDILHRISGKKCSPSMVVHASLIYRIIEDERIDVVEELLKRMLRRNMILDNVAYSMIVRCKVKSGNVDSACHICEEMVKRGHNVNSFVYTALIRGYCRDGRVEDANWLMQEMENLGLRPYDETFNLLIESCAKAGRLQESLSTCKKMMDQGLVPACSAFNKLVEKLCEIGEVKQANEMLTCLLEAGFSPNEVTYSVLISGYGRKLEGEEVLKLCYEMMYKKLPCGSLVLSSIVRSLCLCGKLREAEKYLRMIDNDPPLPDKESLYEMLIKCYVERGDRKEGLRIYQEMIPKGSKSSLLGIFDEV